MRDSRFDDAEAVLDEVRGHHDRAAELARSAAPILLAAAEAVYAGYRAALSCPEAFARGRSRSETSDLVERSIRAEAAVALGVSELVASRELERAQLLVDDLPATRAALRAARIRWEAGTAVCDVAGTLPVVSRAAFDERAVELAASMTPSQLRKALPRLRDELHDQPLAERHARARQDRGMWVTPESDGMAMVSALLAAPVAFALRARVDRTARILFDSEKNDPVGDERTLAQFRADVFADLLCGGDVFGTTPVGDDGGTSVVSGGYAPGTSVPGVRAEVRLTLAASTAAGLDDAHAELDGYGSIPADVARELVGVASSFTSVVTDPVQGTIVSVGRTHRLPPPRMRLFVQLRDQTCRFPGCTRSAATAELDHTVEWRHGGETAVDNLASLCVAHHHVRHGDRWTYVLHPDGTADWTTPTGRRVVTRASVLPGRPPGSQSPGTSLPVRRPGPRFDEPPPF